MDYQVANLISKAAGIVWYYPVVGLSLCAGIYFTIFKLKFIQVKCFRHALSLISGHYDNPDEHGEITHFQALSAALSGTIGLGNIAGVAIAIELGGPGAIFWMWIVGFLGMATKFVECTLGTYYRDEDEHSGEVRGGPMYYIDKGMGSRWQSLAMFFAICLTVGTLGAGGMFQANQAAMALNQYYNVPLYVTGIVLSLFVGIVVIGGIKRIGNVASKIVPTMCGIYVFGALMICVMNYDKLPHVIKIIVEDAFTGSAMVGGGVGGVLLWGVRRAIFSNEAGLGTASIAHAAVKTDYPVREGIVASLGPLVDTLIVCTATAAVVIMAGHYGSGIFHSVKDIEPAAFTLIGKSWNITKDAPPEVDRLKENRKHEDVLSYVPQKKISMMAVPVNIEPGQSLRFSYYREEGDMIVSLVNAEKVLSMTTGDDTNGGALIGIGCQQVGEWGACVITGDALSEGFKGRLEIKPTSLQARWFFDRFEYVDKLEGIALTISSFDDFLKDFGTIFISFSVVLFAFSTMLSWSYYGETALMYVTSRLHHDLNSINPFTSKLSTVYKLIFVISIFVGAIYPLRVIVDFTDLMVGLMVIPNTFAILFLAGKVRKETDNYMKNLRAGNYPMYK